MNTKHNRKIHSKAPTRIDLAGGTLDIWPLYLMTPNATTLNVAIDLFAETEISEVFHPPGKPGVHFHSEDQKASLHMSWEKLSHDHYLDGVGPALELPVKLTRHYLIEKKARGNFDASCEMHFKTIAKSPAGAGLGGSSALSISMIGALHTWAIGPFDAARDGEAAIEIARDVETTVIKVPAGLQDYYGAMFGGLQSLRWLAGKHQRIHLDTSLLKELDDRLILMYSGRSRNSGINNWALYKAFIDGSENVRERFAQIAASTLDLEKALVARDWSKAADAIQAEWKVRHTLASGISTPEMDHAFNIAAREGIRAGKICGAGGGGCFFLFMPHADSSKRKEIEKEISSEHIRVLSFKTVSHGVDVKVEN